MSKTILVAILLCCNSIAHSQNNFLVLKKGHKSILYYWKDSHFTFQLKDGQWLTGILTKITSDSFYLTQEIIRYNTMGTDTLHYGGLAFEIKDVYAVPTKNELIIYDHDQVYVILGHEKFAWVRNGFIFMVVGAGYAGISIANDLANNRPPFAQNNLDGLGIAAGVFLVGVFLHFNFDPYIHIGKRYHLIAS
jgi:hypothetical protein